LTLDVKKSNSSNETPNMMTVGVEKYGLKLTRAKAQNIKKIASVWFCFVFNLPSTWLAKGTLEEYNRKYRSLPHDVIQHRKPTAVQQFHWR
jgi:hypothetical protein